ncbi:hypothetical protein DLAC_09623 [Tieghemostelium lacteum]|uniref:Uncharacterized protein n=1 Tax=Tieghemostelium lacteum TaxID=361077 RepID=A0A151Z6V0_TIELA|nr:hypothetical protein DLAC_09623 [Tieghemostelium lacteum]|eukprot:KYQ89657.1 hypothetical protein DLAC_09623 [Tieghemostelium lacteum]
MMSNSLTDSAYQEDFNGGSLYYSELPIRSSIQKDKYKHWGRRILFYLMLAYFITAITMFPFLITNLTFWFWLIHILYFELDLTTNKNNFFIQILHSLSFVGSFVVMITSIILLVILNPEFIGQRAEKEHHSVAFAWLQNILIHWMPPMFVVVDLFLHKDHIRKRHRIILARDRGQSSTKSLVKDIIKVIWTVCGTMTIVGIWMSQFTIKEVYGVTNYNLSYLIPSMVVLNIIVAIIFLYIIKKKEDSYIRLNT